MKHILGVFISLALFTVPAVAAKGGVNALQDQLDALQAQVDVMAAGDGTAEAIVGTWIGEQNSLVVDRLVKQTSPGVFANEPFFHIFGHVDGGLDVGLGPGNFDELQPFYHSQIMGMGLCGSPPGTAPAIVNCFVPQGTVNVGANPSFWFVKNDRGPITITLARTGMNLTGCTAASCPNAAAAGLRGTVVGNGFFLLRIVSTDVGLCGNAVFQGTAALSLDRTRMTFSGAGIDSDCSHRVFSLNLRKS